MFNILEVFCVEGLSLRLFVKEEHGNNALLLRVEIKEYFIVKVF